MTECICIKTEIFLQIKLELRWQSKVYINSDSQKQKMYWILNLKRKATKKKTKIHGGDGLRREGDMEESKE